MKENICNELKSKHCVLWIFSFFLFVCSIILKNNKWKRQASSTRVTSQLQGPWPVGPVYSFTSSNSIPVFWYSANGFSIWLEPRKRHQINLFSFLFLNNFFLLSRTEKKTRASRRTTLKALKHRQYCGFRFTVWLLFAKEVITANSIF